MDPSSSCSTISGFFPKPDWCTYAHFKSVWVHDLQSDGPDLGQSSLNPSNKEVTNTPKGSRTPVFGLRTRCPRPLDDGGVADKVDSTGPISPFQAFVPETPETSLRIRPRANRWPSNGWKLPSPSKKKTDSKTKGCKCACHCPHSP